MLPLFLPGVHRQNIYFDGHVPPLALSALKGNLCLQFEMQIDLAAQFGDIPLANIAVSAVRPCKRPQTVLIIGRMEEDGGLQRITVRLDDIGKLVAGESRHVDIKQHKVRLQFLDAVRHSEPVLMRIDLDAIVLEQLLGGIQMHFIVVHDQYLLLIQHCNVLLVFPWFFQAAAIERM